MSSFPDRALRWTPAVLLTATLAWVAVRAWRPLSDTDSWWHLRLGEDFLHQHSLAAPDQWSSFATAPWVPTEPLPEVGAALVDRAFGLAGLVWLFSLVLTLLIVTVYSFARVHASALPAAVATMLFVAVGESAMTPRPQLVSYFFLIVVATAWLNTERDLRPRWWLIPLCWLWSWCHGFWFLGVGYGVLAIAAVALGRRAALSDLRRLAAIPIASALVVIANPGGWRVFVAPFVVSARSSYIAEWQRASLMSGPTLLCIGMVGVCLAVWAVHRQEVTWLRVLMALSALLLSVYAARTVVLGALVISPLLASALETLVRRDSLVHEGSPSRPRSSRRERTWLVGLVGVVAVVGAPVVPHTATRPGGVPLALDAPLDRLPTGSVVFNDYALGGWLSWRHPGLDRWIDGLADAYPVTHLADTATVLNLRPGWQQVLAGSGATTALIRQPSPLAHRLSHLGWTRLGEDGGYVLLRRPGTLPKRRPA